MASLVLVDAHFPSVLLPVLEIVLSLIKWGKVGILRWFYSKFFFSLSNSATQPPSECHPANTKPSRRLLVQGVPRTIV